MIDTDRPTRMSMSEAACTRIPVRENLSPVFMVTVRGRRDREGAMTEPT